MKKILFLTTFLFILSIMACTDDSGTSSTNVETEEQRAERLFFDSISTNQASTICLYYTHGGQEKKCIEGPRTSKDLVDSTKLTSNVVRIMVKVPFADTSACNYSNTKIMLNGETLHGLKGDYTSSNTDMAFNDITLPQSKVNTLTIQYDSISCGNIRETYVLIPAPSLNKVIATEVGFDPDARYSVYYAKGRFFARVYPAYYMAEYRVTPDTLNSKCFLKTPLDSIELKMEFEETPEFLYRYPGAMVAISDSIKLAELLQGESKAVLSCALIFLTGASQGPLNHVDYYSETITFKDAQKNFVDEAYWNDSGELVLCANDNIYGNDWANGNFSGHIWVKVVNNGKTEYRHIPLLKYKRNGETVCDFFSTKDIYNNPDSSTSNDSIVVLADFRQEAVVSYDEYSFYKYLDKFIDYDDTLELAGVFESILELIDSKPSDFYYLDSVKIQGYEKRNTDEP